MTTRPIDRLVNLAVSAVESLLSQDETERSILCSGSLHNVDPNQHLCFDVEGSMFDELEGLNPSEPNVSGLVQAGEGFRRTNSGRGTLHLPTPYSLKLQHPNNEGDPRGFKQSRTSEGSWCLRSPYSTPAHCSRNTLTPTASLLNNKLIGTFCSEEQKPHSEISVSQTSWPRTLSAPDEQPATRSGPSSSINTPPETLSHLRCVDKDGKARWWEVYVSYYKEPERLRYCIRRMARTGSPPPTTLRHSKKPYNNYDLAGISFRMRVIEWKNKLHANLPDDERKDEIERRFRYIRATPCLKRFAENQCQEDKAEDYRTALSRLLANLLAPGFDEPCSVSQYTNRQPFTRDSSVARSEHGSHDAIISSVNRDSLSKVSVPQSSLLSTAAWSGDVSSSSDIIYATQHESETWPIHSFRDENGVERHWELSVSHFKGQRPRVVYRLRRLVLTLPCPRTLPRSTNQQCFPSSRYNQTECIKLNVSMSLVSLHRGLTEKQRKNQIKYRHSKIRPTKSIRNFLKLCQADLSDQYRQTVSDALAHLLVPGFDEEPPSAEGEA